MKPETKQELRDQVANQERLLDIQQQAIGDLEDKLYPQKIYLDHADIALILDLLFHAGIDIKSDYQSLENDFPEGLPAASPASFRALYQQEGRLKNLANKIKDQSPRDYDFDTDLQAVVPTESNE
jgi:hypothetical protein|tara:strand:+ start:34 stop:408 length:375 start_codon:yes stop_codon:yes gene_type:complete